MKMKKQKYTNFFSRFFVSIFSRKKPKTINLSDSEWLWLLFAWGESQLSELFNTKSDFLYQVKDKGLKFTTTSLKDNEKIIDVRNFKTNFFDVKKVLLSTMVVNKLKDDDSRDPSDTAKKNAIKALSIWKPVWDYLISQTDTLYIFKEEALKAYPKETMIQHNIGDKPNIQYFFGSTVRISEKLKVAMDIMTSENKKDDQLRLYRYIIMFLLLYNPICFIIGSFVSIILGVFLFMICFMITGIIFYKKDYLFRMIFNNSKKNLFKELIPERRMISNYLGGKLSSKKKYHPSTVGIDLFFDEQDGIKKHIRLLEKELFPSYVQDIDFITLSFMSGEKIEKIEGKDPLMFFEKDDIITIPYYDIQENPVIKILKENIDIEKLDIPKIIYEGIQPKLKMK